MTVPNNHLDWVEKAEHDYQTIQLLQSASGPLDTICFHAQQGAEKLLKAFLVFYNARPPKWHDLGSLLEECIKLDSSLSALDSDCDLLTSGVLARYPGTGMDPDQTITNDMVAASTRIRSEIRHRMKI